jgi:hypothetical protein
MAHDTRLRVLGDSLLSWRADLLRKAGFNPYLAERIAGEPERDLHELIELTERGCPPHLAVRILAPLDSDGSQA